MKINERTYNNRKFTPTLINLFYGSNGSGKSTVGKVIKANASANITWDDADSGIVVKVFNEDYIKENVQSYGNIPGVFTLTKEDADARKELDKKTAEKNEAEALLKQENATATELLSRENGLDEKYWKKAWDKTQTWRKDEFIKVNNGYPGVKKKFFQALKDCTPIQQDHNELFETYNTVFGNEMPKYETYNTIDGISIPSTNLMGKSIKSRSKTDFALFVQSLGNLDWIRHGHDKYLPNSQGKCPFCKGDIDAEAFSSELAACYDEQYKKDMADLETFVRRYKDALNSIYTILHANQNNTYPLTDELKESYQDAFDRLMDKAKANVALIERKLQEPSAELEDPADLSTAIEKMSGCISEINSAITDYMKLVTEPTQKDDVTSAVWSFMAYECADIFEEYESEKQEIKDAKEANNDTLTGIREQVAHLKESIDKLNNSTANTTKVMESINNTLQCIGFKGFYLREKKNASYVYELVRDCDGEENGQVAKDLSEGERNFIALLYFYHDVMGSQSKDGTLVDKVVVIDDPVSSMDQQTLFYVAVLVREMIAVCYNNYKLTEDMPDRHIRQIFCLTHNPVFFREISYNRLSQYECVTIFEITKDADNHSRIDEKYEDIDGVEGGRINKSPVRNYYDSLWHELRTTESKETLMSAARQILDYHFLQTNGYDSTGLRDILFEGENKEEFLKADGTQTLYNIAVSMVALLNVGVSNFNDGLFFDSSAYDLKQMRDAFKIIFEVMGRVQHYNMMMGIRE